MNNDEQILTALVTCLEKMGPSSGLAESLAFQERVRVPYKQCNRLSLIVSIASEKFPERRVWVCYVAFSCVTHGRVAALL